MDKNQKFNQSVMDERTHVRTRVTLYVSEVIIVEKSNIKQFTFCRQFSLILTQGFIIFLKYFNSYKTNKINNQKILQNNTNNNKNKSWISSSFKIKTLLY